MGNKSGSFIGGKKCQNNNGKDREIFKVMQTSHGIFWGDLLGYGV
jgi:hypothetical protein